MQKLFVKDINVIQNEENKPSRKEVERKWSVRKVRRRPLSKEKSLGKSSAEHNNGSKHLNAEVLFIGENISDQLPDTPLFLSSDEDSATSEDGKN